MKSTGQRHLIRLEAENTDEKWKHAHVQINSKDNYTIEFEATLGKARKPVTIAIDSVHFTKDCYAPESRHRISIIVQYTQSKNR